MRKLVITSTSIAALLVFCTVPVLSRDLYELSRKGGRSVDFFDQINKASLIMLDGAGLMTHPVAAKVARGLETVIRQERDAGIQRSDDYLDFEPKLLAVVGQDASRLHIGRSRQDIGATIAQMALRENLIKFSETIASARKRILALAKENKQTIIPAYTHGVQAQPTTFAHYLLAFEYSLSRGNDRLRDAYNRVNRSPFGAAALGTSSFPIDRVRLADLLGFSGLIVNSYDANHVAPVDMSLEVAGGLAITAIQIGQFVQDIHAQYIVPSPWFMLSEGKLTDVSSIMPQKRNPAALEHLRIESSILVGEMQAVALLAHNNRTGMVDYRAFDLVPVERPLMVFDLFEQVLDNLVVDKDRALAEVNADYSTTTEIADALSRKSDVPFRLGHHYASTLTNYGRSHGLKLDEISYADVSRIYKEDTKQNFPLSEAEFKDVINPAHMVNSSKGIGGPQLPEIERMLSEEMSKATSDFSWATVERERLARAETSLNEAVKALAASANVSAAP